MNRDNRTTKRATLRSVEREAKALSARVSPRFAALDVRARRAMRERPVVAIAAAAAFGWLLGRALGARR